VETFPSRHLGHISRSGRSDCLRIRQNGVHDFSNPNVSFWTAILGTGLIWLLTLGAFVMGIHFLKYCITGKFFRVNPWTRALILGALSFFPGFIVSAVPATLLVSKWWPRDIQADNIAMLTSVFVGAALAVVVYVAIIRTGHRNDTAPGR
jgi:uncharacterized MnhB-related membrane protein